MNKPESTSSKAHFLGITLEQKYASLPNVFYAAVTPTPVKQPKWIIANTQLANQLGLDPAQLHTDDTLETLAGNRVIPLSAPVAQAYAGHQFGYFNPQLGDGRAILLGELETANQSLVDIQLKGAGPTPFSRNGDGRSAIGPVIREYIVSEAMHALGIPTTRSLAAVATGEWVYRQQAVPGGVLTRVASSHIRYGTFEYFHSRGLKSEIQQLADFVIHRHYPHLVHSPKPYSNLFTAIAQAQAKLISQWMLVGFIHGVMNTDNTAVSGETLDYGPCAFMDEYHPQKVFSSIDREGRYAYANQPNIGMWNLAQLAECLSYLLIDENPSVDDFVQNTFKQFSGLFNQNWTGGLAKKIGLQTLNGDQDTQLIERLLQLMQQHELDFTLTFRCLSSGLYEFCLSDLEPNMAAQLQQPDSELSRWMTDWRQRVLSQELTQEQLEQAMQQVNPLYIPRNHVIERLIQQAQQGNFDEIHEFCEVLRNPFLEQEGKHHFAKPPMPEQRVTRTFCGT